MHDDAIKWKHFPRYWYFVRGMTQSFDVFFDLPLSKRLSKQPRRQLFNMQSRSLWRHCNGKIWLILFHRRCNFIKLFIQFYYKFISIYFSMLNTPIFCYHLCNIRYASPTSNVLFGLQTRHLRITQILFPRATSRCVQTLGKYLA